MIALTENEREYINALLGPFRSEESLQEAAEAEVMKYAPWPADPSEKWRHCFTH